MRKKIKYRAKNGLILEFGDSEPFFLEKINASSLSGVFSADNLLGAVGQITTSRNYSGRTVTCEFAVVFKTKRFKTFKAQILEKIIIGFSPLVGGILEITSDTGTYSIDCYPSEIPSFDNSKIPYIYRFTVDFICDYPYFRQQGIINKPIINGVNIINSSSVPDTPMKIYIPDCSKGAIIQFKNTLGNNTLRLLAVDGAVTIDTEKFTAISESSGDIGDVSNRIDLSSKIENCKLTYGKNEIILNVPESAKISYYNLVLGVI